ncbi:MAG: glutamine--fructose-6-phosphate aminotransferase, partial [Clostridia bacterium]|nr:glutamine--fructose-6-phosphate aminotransferase [Clostridia bacterium]
MCGIVGYTGKKQAKNILLNSLEKLEYRGYDSAGLAVLDGTDIKYVKTQGRICKLRKATENINLDGYSGIAHTRWATHGTPTEKNSHPHFNTDKTIAVVHNGIIENYEELNTELSAKGYTFTTDTDTEVIPHLIDYYYNSSVIEAIFKTAQKLEGSYAVGVIHADEPHTIIAFKKGSPLIAGTKKDGNFIASDVSALVDETKNVYFIEDNEFAVLKSDGITFYNAEKNIINKKIHTVEYTNETIDKNGFEHFMLKEIYEQPKAVKNTVLEQFSKGTP